MLKYNVVPKKNPMDKSIKFYAQLVPVTPISLEKIAKNIERRSTVSSSDVKAVLDALEFEIMSALEDGKSVRLGDLGSFRLTIGGKGADSPEEFSTELIERVNVRFHPSKKMKVNFIVGSAAQTVTFQREKEREEEEE